MNLINVAYTIVNFDLEMLMEMFSLILNTINIYA